MVCDEFFGEVPIEGVAGAAVDSGCVGVEEYGVGLVGGDVFKGVGIFDADGFDEGEVEFFELCGVFGCFVAVELCDVDGIVLEEGERD